MVIAYLSGVGKRDNVLKALASSFGAEFKDCSSTVLGKPCMFFGFDAMPQLKQCWGQRPFIYIDHAYLKRGYETGNFRVVVDHIHQTKLLDVSGDRLKRLEVRVYDWRKGREVIVLEPSRNVCNVLGVSPRWAEETALRLKNYTDRPIRIKSKGPGLFGELKDCHAVVGLSSVAEVEAAIFGIPVFATEHSPAAPIAEKDFSKIESPIYPDRDAWLRSLSYAQWHVSEMSDGLTRRHLERVLNGDYHICRASGGG